MPEAVVAARDPTPGPPSDHHGPVTSIVWFRRDLRLSDHPALSAAAEAGPVVPVFCNDDRLRGPSGDVRLAYLRATLAALDADLDGGLVVRSGDPADSLAAVAEETGAETIWATDDFGPYGRARDTAVGERLAERGLTVHFRDSPYAVAPGTILTGGSTPYKVFTPFFKAWKAHGWAEPVERPDLDLAAARSDGLPDAPTVDVDLPPAGERAALEQLEAFLDGPVYDYATARDLPGVEGTSRLSAALKWGAIHPRQILERLGPDPSEEVFRSEIAWREFYADVLFARPDSARDAFVPKMAHLRWDDGPPADDRFAAWAEGRTGYPIVDAGMRQLLAEGWMHNRVRMIVGSFLVKDLHLHWRRGAAHFMEHLVDGDLASNQHGWQWVAGTGTDASPFFRVFNPVSQSKKFDPDGDYLRRWVPELAHLGAKRIHEPWADPSGAPAGYPAPIVDHGAERADALARYDELKARTSGG